MPDDFSTPAEYVRLIGDQLRTSGASVDDWLRRCGMEEAEFANPHRMFPYPQLRQLVLEALAIAREPALGLFVGERLLASTHGMVGAAAVNSSTVRQALDIVERFARLRTSLVTISHEVDPREARVRFTEMLPLGDIQRPLLEAIVLGIKNVLDEVTLGACHVSEVSFVFPKPEHATLAREIFGCPVRYDQQWTGFSAPASALESTAQACGPGRVPGRGADLSARARADRGARLDERARAAPAAREAERLPVAPGDRAPLPHDHTHAASAPRGGGDVLSRRSSSPCDTRSPSNT